MRAAGRRPTRRNFGKGRKTYGKRRFKRSTRRKSRGATASSIIHGTSLIDCGQVGPDHAHIMTTGAYPGTDYIAKQGRLVADTSRCMELLAHSYLKTQFRVKKVMWRFRRRAQTGINSTLFPQAQYVNGHSMYIMPNEELMAPPNPGSAGSPEELARLMEWYRQQPSSRMVGLTQDKFHKTMNAVVPRETTLYATDNDTFTNKTFAKCPWLPLQEDLADVPAMATLQYCCPPVMAYASALYAATENQLIAAANYDVTAKVFWEVRGTRIANGMMPPPGGNLPCAHAEPLSPESQEMLSEEGFLDLDEPDHEKCNV